MHLRTPFLLTIGFSLACAGLGKKDDGDDTQDTSPPGGSEPCEAYLDCVTDVDPSAYATAAASYGESGSCWQDTDAASCSAACDAARDELADENPLSQVCGGDGFPAVDGCPFTEGDWQTYFTVRNDTCGWPSPFGGDATLTCRNRSSGRFDWELSELFTTGACTADGLNFTCEADYGGIPLLWLGSFDDWQVQADGEWTYQTTGCSSVGEVEAYLE